MPGGSEAGYARWHAFQRAGLKAYARKRNDFMQRGGVSRLSAYHHAGAVSPWRIAREAQQAGAAPRRRNARRTRSRTLLSCCSALGAATLWPPAPPPSRIRAQVTSSCRAAPAATHRDLSRDLAGADKFIAEFCIWRELSYSWCAHTVAHHATMDAVDVLPDWARDTLAAHARDTRQARSVEDLAAARSGDAAWDAMQAQLAKTGTMQPVRNATHDDSACWRW